MTIKRIYIRGNVGEPMGLNIYDADTDKEIHVTRLVVDVGCRKPARATIDVLHSGVSSVDVVPPPPCPATGKLLKEVELVQYRSTRSATVHRATATDWTVQPDGTVKPNPLTQFYQQHAVDDVVLAQYPGRAADVLEDSARQVLTGVTHHMISPQIAAIMKTGGVVAPNSLGFIPGVGNFKLPTTNPFPPVTQKSDHSKKSNSNSKAVCSECGGSGEYISQITHKKSDCSQGCKRPTK